MKNNLRILLMTSVLLFPVICFSINLSTEYVVTGMSDSSTVAVPSANSWTVNTVTAIELNNGNLMAAFYGGSNPSLHAGQAGNGIWISTGIINNDGSYTWSTASAINNVVPSDSSSNIQACWNPVLCKIATQNSSRIFLFYKTGPKAWYWNGVCRYSDNNGKSWSQAIALPPGIIGPSKDQPVQLKNGSLLWGSSRQTEIGDNWNVYFNTLNNPKDSPTNWKWSISGPVNCATFPSPSAFTIQSIEPTILNYGKGKLQALCRTQNETYVGETWSFDNGQTWSPMILRDGKGSAPDGTPEPIALLNPNTDLDAVTLKSGLQLLIYNPVSSGKTPLCFSTSIDGITWNPNNGTQTSITDDNTIDNCNKAFYPSVMQGKDGTVHVFYTYAKQGEGNFGIKHVMFAPPAAPQNSNTAPEESEQEQNPE